MMKSLGLITVMIFGLILCSNTVSGQKTEKENRKSEKKRLTEEGYESIKKLVHSGMYEFIATRAFPVGGKTIDLTTNPNLVRVNIYDVVADLPFYGTAYSADLSGQGGIHFKEKLSNLVLEEKNSKKMVTATFDINSSGGSYKFTFEIHTTGDARLTVIPSRKSTISYQGRVFAIEEEDKEEKKK